MSVVDAFITDLMESVEEAVNKPSGKGMMVALYGTSLSLFFCINPRDSSVGRSGKFECSRSSDCGRTCHCISRHSL